MNQTISRPSRLALGALAISLSFATTCIHAHVGDHPSVHDTVAGIADRIRNELTEEALKKITAYDVENLLTDDEKHILGTQHVLFSVDVPVRVTIVRDRSLRSEPFWLRESFELTGLVVTINDTEHDVWERDFDAGRIGLGINSFVGGKSPYLILVAPQNAGDPIQFSDLYPGTLRVGDFQDKVKPFTDTEDEIETVPPELSGQKIVRCERRSRDDAKLVNLFRWTDHPVSDRPSHVILTWSDDPTTTQTIQWRTSTNINRSEVAFQEKARFNRFRPTPLEEVRGTTEQLETPNIINDPIIHWHTVRLENLKPATTYVYSVGDGSKDGWSELAEFTTAPAQTVPFSFIYMGDAQNGLDRWGTLARNAFRERPDAAFYLMAGDLVDRGNERDDWDTFFHNASTIFDRRQLVPVIGNHENQGGHPTLYLKQFALMENGPEDIEKERAYWFEYSNALFVVLDSNLDVEKQTPWLEEVLQNSTKTWKFVTYHHPAYSSAPNRDNQSIRKHWVPVFDKHHVDLVLQGHDHAYLRTHPMKDNQPVKSVKDGTVYVVSVSGTKMYDQVERDYIAHGMTNISTYQVLDIQISGDRLVYRAYDIDGNLQDELVIRK